MADAFSAGFKGMGDIIKSMTAPRTRYSSKLDDEKAAQLKKEQEELEKRGYYDDPLRGEVTYGPDESSRAEGAPPSSYIKETGTLRDDWRRPKGLEGGFTKSIKARTRELKWQSKSVKAKAQQEQTKAGLDSMMLEGAKKVKGYGRRMAAQTVKQAEHKTKLDGHKAEREAIEVLRRDEQISRDMDNDDLTAMAALLQAEAAVKRSAVMMKEHVQGVKTADERVKSIQAVREHANNVRVFLGRGHGDGDPIEWMTKAAMMIQQMPKTVADTGTGRAVGEARSSLWNELKVIRDSLETTTDWADSIEASGRDSRAMRSIKNTKGGMEAFERAKAGGNGGEFMMYHSIGVEASKSGMPLNEEEWGKIVVQRQGLGEKAYHRDKDGVPIVHEGVPIKNYEVDVAATWRRWDVYKKNWARYYGATKAQLDTKQVMPTAPKSVFGADPKATGAETDPNKPVTLAQQSVVGSSDALAISPGQVRPLPVGDPSSTQDLLDAIGDPRFDIDTDTRKPFGTVTDQPNAMALRAGAYYDIDQHKRNQLQEKLDAREAERMQGVDKARTHLDSASARVRAIGGDPEVLKDNMGGLSGRIKTAMESWSEAEAEVREEEAAYRAIGVAPPSAESPTRHEMLGLPPSSPATPSGLVPPLPDEGEPDIPPLPTGELEWKDEQISKVTGKKKVYLTAELSGAEDDIDFALGFLDPKGVMAATQRRSGRTDYKALIGKLRSEGLLDKNPEDWPLSIMVPVTGRGRLTSSGRRIVQLKPKKVALDEEAVKKLIKAINSYKNELLVK